LSAIDSEIAAAHGCGLGDVAFTLGMAKLEVQLQLHGITQKELDLFCKAQDDAVPCDERAAARYALEECGVDSNLQELFEAFSNGSPKPHTR
jgi:hypothetical protein